MLYGDLPMCAESNSRNRKHTQIECLDMTIADSLDGWELTFLGWLLCTGRSWTRQLVLVIMRTDSCKIGYTSETWSWGCSMPRGFRVLTVQVARSWARCGSANSTAKNNMSLQQQAGYGAHVPSLFGQIAKKKSLPCVSASILEMFHAGLSSKSQVQVGKCYWISVLLTWCILRVCIELVVGRWGSQAHQSFPLGTQLGQAHALHLLQMVIIKSVQKLQSSLSSRHGFRRNDFQTCEKNLKVSCGIVLLPWNMLCKYVNKQANSFRKDLDIGSGNMRRKNRSSRCPTLEQPCPSRLQNLACPSCMDVLTLLFFVSLNCGGKYRTTPWWLVVKSQN